MNNTPTVDALMRAAFAKPRTPRSDEYKAGIRAVLALRIEGRTLVCPFATGTPSADAFFAGCDEGHAIWRVAEKARADD